MTAAGAAMTQKKIVALNCPTNFNRLTWRRFEVGIVSSLRVLSTVGLLGLTGCTSWLSIGESEFSCSGLPDAGQRCMSAAQVYEATDTRHGARITLGSSSEGATEVAERRPVGGENPAPSDWPMPVPSLGDERVPIRTPAQVLRVYVTPWQSAEGHLFMPGHVYTEVRARQWQIGVTGPVSNGLAQPLDATRGGGPRE